MRSALVLCLCLAGACGATRSDTPAGEPSPKPAQDALIDQLAWLPATTVSVGRMRPGSIFILEWLGDSLGGRKAACWRGVEAKIDAGYSFEVPKQRALTALTAFHGTFNRAEVERCAEALFPEGHFLHLKVRRASEVSLLETADSGTAVLWWIADGWVVVGNAERIAAAQATTTSLSASLCMKRLLPQLPEAPVAVARCDFLFDNLLGIETQGWLIAFSILSKKKGVELAPDDVVVDGRVSVLFASHEDAARAVQAMTAKAFHITLPAPVRDFIGALPAFAEGPRMHIEIRFTQADLAGLDIEAMKKVLDEMPQP